MRVRVEPASIEWLEALVLGDAEFTERFGIPVEDGWAGFPEAVPHALETTRTTDAPQWGTHLFFAEDDGALVGFGGWKAAPVDGEAELGYAVAPARQGRGIATAVVRILVERARAAGVRTVIAHTLREDNPSTSVLKRCGFAFAGDVLDGGDEVWRWELPLAD